MKDIFYGKSIDEAKAKAAEAFGVSEEKIKFTVIEDVFGTKDPVANLQRRIRNHFVK